MNAPGKARRERGSLAEYETQVKEMRWQMGEQVRGLDSQAESRQQLLQDVADFLRRKAEVEQEYSRGLEKLSERFSAKIRGSKEHQNFRKDQNLPSPLNCWYTILNQTRQASRDHGALSEIYTGHLVLRLVHISEDVGRLARKSKEMEQQMQDELLKAISELQMAMKSYQTYRMDCMNAEAKLREAERQEEKRCGGKHSDPSGSPGGAGLDKNPRRTSLRKVERLLEKRQSKFLESKLKCAKARNDYLLNLHTANSVMSNYYVRDVADLLDCFDLGFHLSLGKVLRTYLAAESRAQASWQQGLCSIEGAVDALDPLGDKSRMMEANPAAYCPPLSFDYQPHEGDEVSEVRAEGLLRNELVSRFQHIQSRLNAITLETDEVNKTLKATLQSLIDLLTAEEPEALDAFQGCQSTESLKSTGSDAGGKQALAKRRANQHDTESFYIMKFKEYLSGRSIQTKLQAKHDQMKEAIEKGAAVDRELARPQSQRIRRSRPPSRCHHQLFEGDLQAFLEVPAAALSCSPPAQLLVLLSCPLPSASTLRCPGPAFASGSPQWLLLLPLPVTCLLTLSLLSLLPKEAEAAGTEAGTGLAVGNGSLTRWVGMGEACHPKGHGEDAQVACMMGCAFALEKTHHGCFCTPSYLCMSVSTSICGTVKC